jgi:hypothetical protein
MNSKRQETLKLTSKRKTNIKINPTTKVPSFGGYKFIKDDTKNGSFQKLDYGDTDYIYKVMSTYDQFCLSWHSIIL